MIIFLLKWMLFKKVGIVKGTRTAVGSIAGMFKQVPSPFLLSQTLRPVLEGTPVALLSNAIYSSCLQANLGINPVKQALSMIGIENLPSVCINNGHNGGLKSLLLASQTIELGSQIILCGGFDSSSLAPHSLQGRRTWSQITDELPLAYYSSTGLHYGLAIEEINSKYSISRDEQEDYSRYAFLRRQVAIKKKHFDLEIVGDLTKDELGIYPEHKHINPLFYSAGSVTSLTSALPSDGAVSLLVGNLETIEKLGLDLIGKVAAFVQVRKHPVIFPDILEETVKVLLDSAGIHKSEVNVWEINDFFATIPSVVCKVLKIPMEIVNIYGGNLAFGDTLAASSAKCALNCCKALQERNEKYAVAISSNCDGEVIALLIKK